MSLPLLRQQWGTRLAHHVGHCSPAQLLALHAPRLTPQVPRPPLHASRLTLQDAKAQRVQVVRRPSPAGYCHSPTAELGKTERDPISTIGPSIFSMSPKFSMLPNQAICSDKSVRFSPLASARSLTTLPWPEALNARGSRRAS